MLFDCLNKFFHLMYYTDAVAPLPLIETQEAAPPPPPPPMAPPPLPLTLGQYYFYETANHTKIG